MTRLTRRTAMAGLASALTFPTMAQAGKAHKVSIKNMDFSPAKMSITAGDSVVWTNRDSDRHTATADDKSWDTGTLKKGKSGTITFSKPGTYSYFCAVHPRMKGVVIVS